MGICTSGAPPHPDIYVTYQGVAEGDLITKEDREEGQIGSKVYLYYARAYGCVAEQLHDRLACARTPFMSITSACMCCPKVAATVLARRVLEHGAESEYPDKLVS